MELNKIYGEGIVKAIVESYDQRYLADLENLKLKHKESHLNEGGIGQPGAFYPPFPSYILR